MASPQSLFDELVAADPHLVCNLSSSHSYISSQPNHEKLCFTEPEPDSLFCVKNNILVYGDKSAGGVASGLLKFINPCEYSVYGESHPGYSISQMAQNIFHLTTEFNFHDTVIICLNLDPLFRFNSYLLNKLLSVGKYTNLILSLTYSNHNNNKYRNFISLCHNFLDCYKASIRILDNIIVNGSFRLSRQSLFKYLSLYVSASCMIKKSFVLTYVNYCDIKSTPNKGKLNLNCRENDNGDCSFLV